MTCLVRIRSAVPLLGMALLGACARPDPPPARLAPTLTASPSATRTPTPSPTATATASRLGIEPLDLRPTAAAVNPQFGAPCGMVDFFDFPLDAPDGGTVRGGQDFGLFRERYEGYHTGEDWWHQPGPSLGKPVYSIGWGRVTYAHPHGWGDDLGTLVIQHVLPTGRVLYAFYGHLDPESLTLRRGECITRGQMIGRIGRPRSSPHLHFEIRLSLPDQPGPGYWPVDPRLGGWREPSRVIQESRLAVDPRVSWSRSVEASQIELLGSLPDGSPLVLEDGQLTTIALVDGSSTGMLAIPGPSQAVLWQPDAQVLVTANRSGQVTAVRIPETPVREGSGLEPSWSVELASFRSPRMLDLGMGAVAVGSGEVWNAFDGTGGFLWQHDLGGEVLASVQTLHGTIATTDGAAADIWMLTPDGALAWGAGKSGRLASIGGQIYLLARDGLFLLDIQNRQVSLLHPWSPVYLEASQVVGLPGGNLLVTHRDLYDQRLMLISGAGELIWERSYAFLNGARNSQLFVFEAQAYLLAAENQVSSIDYTLFRIDEGPVLQPVFRSILRQEPRSDNRVLTTSEGILLTLGGRTQLLIALEAPG